MSRTVTVELTDDEYARIEREANASNRTPAEVIGAAVRRHTTWIDLDAPPDEDDDEKPPLFTGPITAAEMEYLYQKTAAEISARTGRPTDEIIADMKARIRGTSEPIRSDAERQADWRSLEDLFGSVDSGDPHSADNDRIDADLAREYGRGLEWDE